MATCLKRKEKPRWDLLPDLVVERIFVHLEKRSRYNAACTCRSWLRVLSFPELWKTFIVREKTLTRSRFDYYKGYQDVLCPFVTQICLKRIGWHFRKLKIVPIANFMNLFEFINIVDSYLAYYEESPMPHLKSFEFQFSCRIRNREGIQVFGTGGRILLSLTTLLSHLRNLESLKLENLLLERLEASSLLNNVLDSCGESLRNLELINCSMMNYFFMHSGVFLNLRSLTISVNHLHRDLVYLLGDLENFEEFHVVQTEFTNSASHLSARDWAPIRKKRDKVVLFFESRGRTKEEITWQCGAPIHHIVHGSPYAKLTHDSALQIVHNQYDITLRSYCQFGIPRFSYRRGRPFHERCDAQLLMMIRICTRLTTLAIRELMSTSTLLLIAFHTKGQLKNLYVRRNAVLLRMDWGKERECSWALEFEDWLTRSSKNYSVFEREMSSLLGRKWRLLTDFEFKKLSNNDLKNG